jgi:hypothetical protein
MFMSSLPAVDPLAALQFDVAGGAAPADLGLRPSRRV